MTGFTTLQGMLNNIFKAPKPKRASEPYRVRKARTEAKALAAQYGIEIENDRDTGLAVWAPNAIGDEADPFAGDHHASDWPDALSMVQTYVGILEQANG